MCCYRKPDDAGGLGCMVDSTESERLAAEIHKDVWTELIPEDMHNTEMIA